MVVLLPVPGWLTSIAQGVQKEKMKKVRGGALAFALESRWSSSLSPRSSSLDGQQSSNRNRDHERVEDDQDVWVGEKNTIPYRREA